VNAPDSTRQALEKTGKTLRDTILTLEKLYMLPDDAKGIQRDPDNLQAALYTASGYIGDVKGNTSQMADLTLEQARRKTQAVIDRINAFMSGPFAEYKAAVEAVRFSLFKELEPLRMD
jgi:hypothetical protein